MKKLISLLLILSAVVSTLGCDASVGKQNQADDYRNSLGSASFLTSKPFNGNSFAGPTAVDQDSKEDTSVTQEGIVTEVSPVQPENENSPMTTILPSEGIALFWQPVTKVLELLSMMQLSLL